MTNPFKQPQNIWKLNFPSYFHMLPIFEEYFADITDNICCYEISSKTVESMPDDLWRFEAYLENNIDIEALKKQLQKIAPDWTFAEEITLELLEDIDWAKKVQENFSPMEVGDFFITNPNSAHLCPEGKNKIIIEASRAFGTGEHQTTQGCIEAIDSQKNENYSHILDVGTGTGILAIVASKIWPNANVIGSDIEEIAVEISNLHAKTNDVKVEFLFCDGAPSLEDQVDLLISNILAKPLIAMAEDFRKIINENGKVILSGFLHYQLASILEAYINNGFTPISIINKNNWITLTLKPE